jgi:Domain of unknown function (DUF6485)
VDWDTVHRVFYREVSADRHFCDFIGKHTKEIGLMAGECKNFERNMDMCNCSYPGCSRKGYCCDCLASHLKSRQLPGCCFPNSVEKTYDRSFEAFAKAHNL